MLFYMSLIETLPVYVADSSANLRMQCAKVCQLFCDVLLLLKVRDPRRVGTQYLGLVWLFSLLNFFPHVIRLLKRFLKIFILCLIVTMVLKPYSYSLVHCIQ